MIRRLNTDDLSEVESWYLKRGMTPIKRELFPETAYISPGIAACFLYRTDSALFLIEEMISNPESDADARNSALDSIIEALLKDIPQGSVVLALTNHPRVIERAVSHGFIVSSQFTSLVREV